MRQRDIANRRRSKRRRPQGKGNLLGDILLMEIYAKMCVLFSAICNYLNILLL